MLLPSLFLDAFVRHIVTALPPRDYPLLSTEDLFPAWRSLVCSSLENSSSLLSLRFSNIRAFRLSLCLLIDSVTLSKTHLDLLGRNNNIHEPNLNQTTTRSPELLQEQEPEQKQEHNQD